MLRDRTVPVTAFQQNCSIVWCDTTGRAAVIDPGGELPRLRAEVAALGVTLEAIWLTHAHIDHAGAAAQWAREDGLPIVGPHEGDRFWIDALPEQGAMFGFPPSERFEPARWLCPGGAPDAVTLGDCSLEVRHCPGHTPGHVAFVSRDARRAFVGDVLFDGSIGRTDFPGGDFDTLVRSIRTQLWPFGDDVRFVPGHGPESSFGEQRRFNPFVRGG